MFVEIRNVVRKIPRGKVATYGAVAEAAGFPGNARRVAWALRNTDGKLPWHRVLGSGGKILLPKEAGAEQRFRLQAEGVEFRGAKVWMEEYEFRFPKAKTSRRKRAG